jgi:hypothetical protein
VTVDHQDDLILRAVSQIAHIEQDEVRAQRTRVRCRRELQWRARVARRRESARSRREPLLIAGFSLAYLTALLGNLLRWKGVL